MYHVRINSTRILQWHNNIIFQRVSHVIKTVCNPNKKNNETWIMVKSIHNSWTCVNVPVILQTYVKQIKQTSLVTFLTHIWVTTNIPEFSEISFAQKNFFYKEREFHIYKNSLDNIGTTIVSILPYHVGSISVVTWNLKTISPAYIYNIVLICGSYNL